MPGAWDTAAHKASESAWETTAWVLKEYPTPTPRPTALIREHLPVFKTYLSSVQGQGLHPSKL